MSKEDTRNHYGGRGISICKRWRKNFVCFYKWSLSNGYKNILIIDRKNNNGNYTPKNCRYTTRKVNNSNTRRSRYWIVFGKKFSSAKQASKYHNVDRQTIGNWCLGHGKGKYTYPPRPNCSTIRKYKNADN